jgi:hypothetical protein
MPAATDEYWARFGAVERLRTSNDQDESDFHRLLAAETGMWMPTDDLT